MGHDRRVKHADAMEEARPALAAKVFRGHIRAASRFADSVSFYIVPEAPLGVLIDRMIEPVHRQAALVVCLSCRHVGREGSRIALLQLKGCHVSSARHDKIEKTD